MDALLNPDFEIVTTLRQRLIETYDAVVWSIDHNQIPLTEELLETTIPETLFEYAVVSGWLPEPDKDSAPAEPCYISGHPVEKRYAESFFALLEDTIAHWLNELEVDKDRDWEEKLKKFMPSKPDPSKDTPATLLEGWRLAKMQDNFTLLAEKASNISRTKTTFKTFEAMLSAIYRIIDETNVNRETLECVAEAMSTPVRTVAWHGLRWPKKPRTRRRRKIANKE